MSKLPISACIISGPEAGRIRKALESLAGWVSEIVLVLNEDVADGTAEIAEEYGAKVFREPWKGYAAQKNSANEKAAQPWILSLDADEAISEPLRNEIAGLFDNPFRLAAFAAFSFPRCSFYCNRWIRHGDWYPDRKTRLWKRGAARWEGIIHEKLIVDGPVGKLRRDLLHYTNESINHQIQKQMSFAEDFVKQALASGRGAGWGDLLVRPFWRFVRGYILRLGFLDGWPGYYIACVAAFSAATRYCKVREARLCTPLK